MPSGRPDKQRVLLDGALRAFARDGYTRASIELIAQEAAVSTRTIYNHYGDKASLFRAVIVDSAQRTARHQIEIVRRHLSRIIDLEEDLVAFGLAWASPDPETALHFALVNQIRADAAHIPDDIIESWQQEGPLRVRAEIATQLSRLAKAGTLRIPPGTHARQLAAHHLVILTAGVADRPGSPPTRAELKRIIRSGVRVFLCGYTGDGV